MGWVEIKHTDNCYGYNCIRVNGKNIFRHRLIASCYLGLNIDDPLQQIDNINRNKMDNRIENLRIVTNQQNTFNKGARGYTWHTHSNKWQAKITVNNKNISLGYFDNEEEAHRAYLNGKAIYHII